jgi:putative transposase
MTAWLATRGHIVNRKCVHRLMRLMALVAIYQRPSTSKAAAVHKIYPYLLSGLTIERVNQVCCSDVTYPDGQGPSLPGGHYGLGEPRRAGLATVEHLTAEFCVEAVEEALARHGRPEILIPTRAASSPATTSPAR